MDVLWPPPAAPFIYSPPPLAPVVELPLQAECLNSACELIPAIYEVRTRARALSLSFSLSSSHSALTSSVLTPRGNIREHHQGLGSIRRPPGCRFLCIPQVRSPMPMRNAWVSA
jgi:hypothetical protein